MTGFGESDCAGVITPDKLKLKSTSFDVKWLVSINFSIVQEIVCPVSISVLLSLFVTTDSSYQPAGRPSS